MKEFTTYAFMIAVLIQLVLINNNLIQFKKQLITQMEKP
jgi:hypothetical protein